jgi:hypothetical protein
MKILEIIEFRSAVSNPKELQSLIHGLIDDIGEEARKMGITAYSHFAIETDFSIHLRHDRGKLEKSGSPLGLRIASSLKEYGLVNHSIWAEMSEKHQRGYENKKRRAGHE